MHQDKGRQQGRETVTGALTRMAPWNIGSRMLVMACIFVTSIIIVRSLSKEEFGVYTLLKTFFLYAWLLGGLGLHHTVLRFSSELSEKGGIYGYRRLLKKCFICQSLSVVVMLVGFSVAGLFMERSYSVGPGLMALMVIWSALMMWKETIRQVFLAHYWVRFIAAVSVGSTLLFPVLAILFLEVLKISVAGAILAEAAVYLVMILTYLAVLRRLGRQVRKSAAGDTERETYEISNYRIFRYSGAFIGNTAVSLLSAKTMIIVAVFFTLGEGKTGVFGLAAEVSEQGLMIVLMPVMGLIMAALTKAYSVDKSRLPSLIRSYYKMMMVMLIPMAFGSIVFMDKLMRLVYQDKGVASGQLGRIAFVLFASMIVGTPMSAGLNLLEKAQHLILVRVLTGFIFMAMLIAGLLFWEYVPLVGHTDPLYSIIAVSILRLVFLIPMILYVGRRLMGSLYFPVAYFFRAVAASSFIFLLWPMRWLWEWLFDLAQPGRSDAHWGLIGLFVLTPIVCAAAVGAGIRIFGLFGREEVHYFQNARLPGRALLMRLLVPGRYRLPS